MIFTLWGQALIVNVTVWSGWKRHPFTRELEGFIVSAEWAVKTARSSIHRIDTIASLSIADWQCVELQNLADDARGILIQAKALRREAHLAYRGGCYALSSQDDRFPDEDLVYRLKELKSELESHHRARRTILGMLAPI